MAGQHISLVCGDERLTEHVSRPGIFTEELNLLPQGFAQTEKKLCTALDAGHFIAWPRLETLGELLDRQLLQPLHVHLVLVVLITRKQPLRNC